MTKIRINEQTYTTAEGRGEVTTTMLVALSGDAARVFELADGRTLVVGAHQVAIIDDDAQSVPMRLN